MIVAVLAANVYCDDWYTWRGPSANGISDETGWNPKGAKKIWTKELTVGYSTVSVKGSKLYTMEHADGVDTVYCLDARTGEKIWDYTYSCETGKYKGPRATPVVDGANLYTVSRAGNVIYFDAASGKVKWDTDVLGKTGNENIRWGIASSANGTLSSALT